MKKLVFLEYTFMMEEGTYSHLYQFEQDLSKHFATIGMEAEIVKTVEGGSAKRILLIKKKDLPSINGPAEKAGRPKFIGNQIRSLAERHLRAPARDFLKKTK